MLNIWNLLSTIPEKDPETGKLITELTIPESLMYAVIGFIVTFIGIVVIIFIIWLAGLIARKSVARKKASADMQEQYGAAHDALPDDGGISEAERVAIIAAIAAYYESENAAVSEFKVRRIRRI